MAAFSRRRPGYKWGIGVFLLGLVLFIVGFATLNWADYTYSVAVNGSLNLTFLVDGHAGLWRVCYEDVYGDTHCSKIEETTNWLLTVRVMQCAALAIMILCLFYLVYVNCLTNDPPTFRLLETGTGLAGGLGLAGILVYAILIKDQERFIDGLEGNHDLSYNLSWSFGLSVAGSLLLILATILWIVFNRPLHPQQQPHPHAFYGDGMPMGSHGPALGSMEVDPGARHMDTHPHAVYGSPHARRMHGAYSPSYYVNRPPSSVDHSGLMVFNTPVPYGMKR